MTDSETGDTTTGVETYRDGELTFKLPESRYWGRPVSRGAWHIFDSNERRTLCDRYNSDGVETGPSADTIPGSVCSDCADASPNLKATKLETANGRGTLAESGDHPIDMAEFRPDCPDCETPTRNMENSVYAECPECGWWGDKTAILSERDSGDPTKPMTDGGLELPGGHQITAKTHGKAVLESLPDPDESYPSLNWNYREQTPLHFECSCGEHLDDDARSVVNHLLEIGAYDTDAATDGGETDA